MPCPDPPLCETLDDAALRLHCPAKLNLALSVGSLRADGLHPIASWMVPIGFGDTLTLRRGDGPGGFTIRGAEDAPLPLAIDWPLESDLAYRAHRAVEQHVGRALSVETTLLKRIPAGAGLGGGSADAAGMIDGLDRLFALGLDQPTLMSLARALGSDVVFQLAARRRAGGARVSGTGDVIEPLTTVDPVALLLVLPGVHCSTPAVYRAFDEASSAKQSSEADPARVAALAGRPLAPDAPLFNDLAEPACSVQPVLREVMASLRGLNLQPHITGSGSAVFVVLGQTPEPDHAAHLIEQVREATRCSALVTHTTG